MEIYNSIISIGSYEVLYASMGFWNEKNEMSDSKHVIQNLNGADVKCDQVDLQIKIHWEKQREAIKSIDFIMPRDEAKLSDIFFTTPYGLIKKNRTGIGATTLELNSPRNSIVVVPTKTLAFEKAKNSHIEDSNRYKILYVGSRIPNFTPPSIEDYLSDTEIQYKKFIVVADSLPKLLQKIDEDSYKDYFIMIDEIDSYQYDGAYRPALEDVIDYYFLFPETKRCLVSATIGSFSNPEIESEPVINITFNAAQPRNIVLFHTQNVVETAKKQIENILAEHPNDKILIAYNAVRNGIMAIIKSLDQTYNDNCAILCSTKQRHYIADYYAEIIERKLPKQITFMTCSYFVGIDIDEPFHLISIANTSYPYTLLSEDKLQQIAGRCRVVDGLLSETIIYKSAYKEPVKIEKVHEEILEDTSLLVAYAYKIKQVQRVFPEIVNEISVRDIIKCSSKSYYGTNKVTLVRKGIDNTVKPAFFNIDNLLIQLQLLQTLYISPEALENQLSNQGHTVICCEDEVSSTCLDENIQQEIESERLQVDEDIVDEIIQLLEECSNIEERKSLAHSLRYDYPSSGQIFLDRFLELQEYVPFDIIKERLPLCDRIKDYKNFYNSVLFWSLDNQHPLKTFFYASFPLNIVFSGNTLTEKFNNLWQGILGYDVLTNNQAFPKIKLFCKLSERTSTRVGGRTVNGYKVISYDVLGLNDECEPVTIIPANIDMRNKFRF